jgi:predicted HicB family RNase H-like nuclease
MSPRTGRPRKFRASRNLVIRVEEKLHALLTKLAEEKDVTVSELVRPLLEGLTGGKGKQLTRGKR